jgi:hypothetical protein
MSAPHLATPTDAERLAATAKRHLADTKRLRTAEQRVRTLTAQVTRLERLLLALVSRSTLPPAVRQEILGVLAGTRSSAAIPTPQEQYLVTTYRHLNDRRKRLLSLLVKEFAERSSRRRRVTR